MLWLHCATPHNLTPNHTPHHPRGLPYHPGTIRVISETGDEMRNRLRMHPPNYTRLPPPITPGYQGPPFYTTRVPPIHPPPFYTTRGPPNPPPHSTLPCPRSTPHSTLPGSHQSHPHHPQGLPYHSPTILHRVLRNRS